MATPFDRLMSTVRPHLVGAFDEAIKQELFLMLKDFFNKSDVWQETIPFTINAGGSTATLNPAVGSIIRLMHVFTDSGTAVRGATMKQIPIVSMPYPSNTAETFDAVVSLTVTDPVAVDAYPIIPVEVLDRYLETLVSGLLMRMMIQPSKPYTNLGMAQIHNAKFNGGAARAKNEMKQGNTFASQAWTFPQTFANR